MSGNYGRLAPGKFGFAWGLIWAIAILLTGWTAWLWDYGTPFVQMMGHLYIGYTPTLLGAVWGACWGFVDFFIFTWLVALVYNCCCKGCPRTSGESSV